VVENADDPADGYFGASVARDYDALSADRFAPEAIEPVVARLAELAAGGRALEFAIGTGRIALPLAAAGVQVDGIELSRAMADELRRKPGGESIKVTIGDMASTRVDGTYSLVYLVFNTIANLTTQQEQVACFRNAAEHLAPGGFFVIEVGVPSLRRLPPGQNAVPFLITRERLGFDTFDPATQQTSSHHIIFRDGAAEYREIPFRYVWPSELDLMAQLAGMHAYARWSDWSGAPFTGESTQHVSVWQKLR